jgi:hypothetical protein
VAEVPLRFGQTHNPTTLVFLFNELKVLLENETEI